MKKERIRILEMVENGKISVDEATKLFEAMGSSKEINNLYSDDLEEKMKNFSKTVESFANDFTIKLNDKYKSVEPKLKSATRTVLEKTASIADDISKSLRESLSNLSEDLTEKNCEKKEECPEGENKAQCPEGENKCN